MRTIRVRRGGVVDHDSLSPRGQRIVELVRAHDALLGLEHCGGVEFHFGRDTADGAVVSAKLTLHIRGGNGQPLDNGTVT